MKSVILPAAALALAASAFPSPEARAENLVQYWADGVSTEGGWLDGLQYPNHCWAACCSNMLAWWQDRLAEKYVLPAGVPRTNEELKAWYYTNYGSIQGGQLPSPGLNYYFEAFYPELDIYAYQAGARYSYSTYGGLPSLINEYLYESFSRADGKVVATISSDTHAVTLWGAEFDESVEGSPRLTRAWITDSVGRDGGSSDTHELEEYLAVYGESTGGGPILSLQRSLYDSSTGVSTTSVLYIEDICFLSYEDYRLMDKNGEFFFTAIPEPSAFGMLAGTLALALAGTRRRRRRKA